MPRPSPLTDADEALLKARLAEYRSTPSAEKEAFRDACAKYILCARQLDDSNDLLLELFSAKVRNWFQNNTPTETKQARLPLRINQSFHPLRIFGHKNRDLVRQTLAKENAAHPADTRAYIVQWNETVRRLWDKLSEEEQWPYVHLAELWSVQGPDDDLKPWMAERRSGSWLRAVAHMLWVQCGMPVFIYGMFKDSNGKLRATVYDTTELWAEANPSTPLFRLIKDWDLDFRRTIWTFLQAILDPTQASQDTLQFVQTIRRQPPAAITFERYSDGTPIMPQEPEVSEKKGRLTSRRQQILREYLRIHYSHATGREMKSVPWQSIRESPDSFFTPGMLPPGFFMQDPSKITDDELTTFFTHVAKMEKRPDSEVNRFQFGFYETGPKGNRSYHPAIYSGTVEAAEPRRQKKSVRVPGFEGPPSDGESEVSRFSLPPPAKSGGATVPRGSRMHTALDTDFAKVTATLAAASVESSTSTPEPPEPAKPVGHSAPATKGKQKVSQPWLDAQFDAAGTATTTWMDTDDDLDDLWVPPRSVHDDLLNDLSLASDDEVEDVLDFMNAGLGADIHSLDALLDDALHSLDGALSGALLEASAHESSPPTDGLVLPPLPTTSEPTTARRMRCPARSLASPMAPDSLERTGDQRLGFLRGLAEDGAYQKLIQLMDAEIRDVVTIRGKAPVMWCTWGLQLAHVPKTIQESEKNVKSLFNWVKKGIPQSSGSADIQRYCLVVGLILSDLDFIEDTNGVDPWPEDLPGFLVYSQLDGEHRDVVLGACEDIVAARMGSEADDASRAPPPVDAAMPKASRGHGRPAQRTLAGSGAGATAPGPSGVPARTTRSSTRRS